MSIGTEYLNASLRRLRYYKSLADRTFEKLKDDDFYFQPDTVSNSIAVIIQHMNGNMMSRWTNFLAEDGEKSWRKRDDEFVVHAYSRRQLLEYWEEGWACFLNAVESLKEEDLLKDIQIRGESLTVIDAINRQLAHYPYHVGQIVYLGRMIKKEEWESLSIPLGNSDVYNKSGEIKDPSRKF